MVDYTPVPSDWDHMNSGMGMGPGQHINSTLKTESTGSLGVAYKQTWHSLVYQQDGNLVLYRITSYGAPEAGDGDSAIGSLLAELAAGGGEVPGGQVGDDIVEVLWATGTNGRSAGAAVMQTDGNFVVYDAGDQAVWASGTGPEHAGENVWLRVQEDGNLALYKGHAPGDDNWVSIWATGTNSG